MPAKIYRVTKGKGVARRIIRARTLLLADEKQTGGAWKDADIAKALGVHVARSKEPEKNVWKWVLKPP